MDFKPAWLVAILLAASAVEAADEAPAPTPAPTAKCESVPKGVTVAGVTVTNREATTTSDGPVVRLGDSIAIHVTGLPLLLAQADCLKKPGVSSGELILFLDGRPLTGLKPYPPTDTTQETITFTLKRTEDAREAWTYILGKPRFDPRKTQVSVGIQGFSAIEPGASVSFEILHSGWFTFWCLLFLGLVIGFFVLARKSDLLRDTSTSLTAARRPFSLARAQAAWWFFFVLASYLFIGIVLGDFSTSITDTVLVLLGISAGTTVGSAFIDSGKDTGDQQVIQDNKIASLEADLTQIAVDTAAAHATAVDATATAADRAAAARTEAAKTSEKAVKTSQLRKLRNESEGFVLDVLSDANGVNFHRFQIAAWTIVLGIVFVTEVYRSLAMPEFSATLLSLMGISAGTYLGLKIPEATVPK